MTLLDKILDILVFPTTVWAWWHVIIGFADGKWIGFPPLPFISDPVYPIVYMLPIAIIYTFWSISVLRRVVHN